jgi:hypothetical protein
VLPFQALDLVHVAFIPAFAAWEAQPALPRIFGAAWLLLRLLLLLVDCWYTPRGDAGWIRGSICTFLSIASCRCLLSCG